MRTSEIRSGNVGVLVRLLASVAAVGLSVSMAAPAAGQPFEPSPTPIIPVEPAQPVIPDTPPVYEEPALPQAPVVPDVPFVPPAPAPVELPPAPEPAPVPVPEPEPVPLPEPEPAPAPPPAPEPLPELEPEPAPPVEESPPVQQAPVDEPDPAQEPVVEQPETNPEPESVPEPQPSAEPSVDTPAPPSNEDSTAPSGEVAEPSGQPEPSTEPSEESSSNPEPSPSSEPEPGVTDEGTTDGSAEPSPSAEEGTPPSEVAGEDTSTEPTAPPDVPEVPAQNEVGQSGSTPSSSASAEDALNVTPLLQEKEAASGPEKVQAPSEEAVTKAANATPVDYTPQFREEDRKEIFDSLVSAARARDKDRDHGGPGRDRDHDKDPWDGKVRHWEWVKYDKWHRPIFYNPCNQPVKIIYYHGGHPQFVFVPVGGSIRINVELTGVIPFTAFNLHGGIALNVSGGFIWGGGWHPRPGAYYPPPGWHPPAPPPVYNNVVVVVKNVNVYYAPTRVKKVVVVNDCKGRRDCQDCVMLDGTHRMWGSWQKGRDGNKYFLASQSERMPGFDQRVEGPSESVTNDYNLNLVGDQQRFQATASEAMDQGPSDVLIIGLSAVAVAFVIGIGWLLTRRRGVHS